MEIQCKENKICYNIPNSVTNTGYCCIWRTSKDYNPLSLLFVCTLALIQVHWKKEVMSFVMEVT